MSIKTGNLVMARIHVSVGNSNKLSSKHTGPYRVTESAGGNNLKAHVYKGEVQIRHADDLKYTNMDAD